MTTEQVENARRMLLAAEQHRGWRRVCQHLGLDTVAYVNFVNGDVHALTADQIAAVLADPLVQGSIAAWPHRR